MISPSEQRARASGAIDLLLGDYRGITIHQSAGMGMAPRVQTDETLFRRLRDRMIGITRLIGRGIGQNQVTIKVVQR